MKHTSLQVLTKLKENEQLCLFRTEHLRLTARIRSIMWRAEGLCNVCNEQQTNYCAGTSIKRAPRPIRSISST